MKHNKAEPNIKRRACVCSQRAFSEPRWPFVGFKENVIIGEGSHHSPTYQANQTKVMQKNLTSSQTFKANFQCVRSDSKMGRLKGMEADGSGDGTWG